MSGGEWKTAVVAVFTVVGAGTVYALPDNVVQLAQLESIQRRGGEADVPPPRARAVEPALQKRAPDTTGVWYHIRHKNLPRAQAEFDRLQAENPKWSPPDDLRRAVAGQNAMPASPP